MTGGEAYKATLISDATLDPAIMAYLADPSKPAAPEVGKGSLDDGAAVLAHAYAVEVLAQEGVTELQRTHAVKTAVLLASVG
ncbi:hypothetical protein VQ02_06070 [Methylobacterium variabile]|jgi:hypothetical protein|uniref:Uncharacterized protein n=1 Tax=Methylobacterium variabile TaxID=298794 RepID=A0A0J6T1A2_9HYPH|nr:hypothetical protein [Methylobacterium variabile]KMO41235.1 hypothetical protein VQ02_06070 [Methylobacterium variabile]